MSNRVAWNKGIPCSEESKKKNSLAHLGKKRGPHSVETIEKIRASNLGQKRSTETKKRISEVVKKRPPPTQESRDKARLRMLGNTYGSGLKGKPKTKEHREKISAAHMGKKQASPSKETKRKMRIAHVTHIKKNYGNAFPAYNLKACEFFRDMDIDHGTKGRYAVYGGGEVYIEELGYWLDYINYETKTIIEWYEPFHFKKNGKLKSKDIARERAIKSHFPDYTFMTIRGGI